MRPIDEYFLKHQEPTLGCLQFMREHILRFSDSLTEEWKYGMPFYCYKGRMCCYLWVHKKNKQPYLGIVEGSLSNHPDLIAEKRAKMKILLLDPYKDVPIEDINTILNDVIDHYKEQALTH